MSQTRILVSARDPAAAYQIAEICLAIREDPRFILTIVAQPPAHGILRARGLTVREVFPAISRSAGDVAATALLAEAELIHDEVGPQVLLCGLSCPAEGGIDEALLARSSVPSFLMQDFWGEQNSFFGRGADTLLVLDQVAATLSMARHGLPAIVTGSPRHGEYRQFDSAAARRRMRDALGFAADAVVIGLFGQPLQALPGYLRTLTRWAAAARNLPFKPVFIYRPHPREQATGRSWTESELRRLGITARTLDEGSTEEALSACDVACTVFSNCAYDGAYLNYFHTQPLVTPMMLLFDEEIVAFYSGIARFADLPYFSQGLALPVWHERDLRAALVDATVGPAREQVWRAARATLPDPSNAVDRVLAALSGSR